MKLHVVGDSHTNVFRDFLAMEPFVVYQMPGVTAYHLADKPELWDYIEKKVDATQDALLLVVGEIDCRIHINYQYEKHGRTRPLPEFVIETVNSYGRALARLREAGVNFAVYGVVPAGRWANEPEFEGRKAAPLPRRIEVHRFFHLCLKVYCHVHDYKLVDIWDRVIGEDGLTRRELTCDEVHLDEKAVPFIVAEIERAFDIHVDGHGH